MDESGAITMRGVLGFVPAVLGTITVVLFGVWFAVTLGELERTPEVVVTCRDERIYPGYSYPMRTVCRYRQNGRTVETTPAGAEAARSGARDAVETKAIGIGLITGITLVVTIVLWITALPARPRAAGNAPVRAPAQHYAAPGTDNYRLLLLMSGSRATAESLIAYERRLLPTASRAFLIRKAIERLRRDRDRQG